MSSTSERTCKVATCPVNTGGECLEGFSSTEIEKCVNFGHPIENVPLKTAGNEPPPSNLLLVNPGQALTIEEGNPIAKGEPVCLIVLAGSIRSGKTTLAASIYESFRKGPFSECFFAGSRTILGFEERCHLSREASGQSEEDTERTKAGIPDVLLHLRIRANNGKSPPLNLLLCDMSGELFEAANQSDQSLAEVPLLKRADHVVLVLDGEKLAQMDVRHRVRQDALTLIRSCLQIGQMHQRTNLSLVFSKQDMLEGLPTRAVVEAFQTEIESEITARFSSQLGSVTFHRISTRPVPDSQAQGLFKLWIQEKPAQQLNVIYPPFNSMSREIDRFAWKSPSVDGRTSHE